MCARALRRDIWRTLCRNSAIVSTSGQASPFRAISYVAAIILCCSVLQCVAVCCRALQCAAVCCGVLQCVAVCSVSRTWRRLF